MLAEFQLQNFILIEEAHLTFTDGLNILSGETGAGKSLLATALGTVLGTHRFQTNQIRKGASEAALTAVFELNEETRKALEKELGLDLSDAADEGLILQRRLPLEGRGRSSINGRTVSLALLRRSGQLLLDMAAQDEHNALRDPSRQRYYLDRFGTLDKPAAAAAHACERFLHLYEQLRGGDTLRRSRQAELEKTERALEELTTLQPDPKADADLNSRLALLENAERVQQFCAEAVESLYESDHSLCSSLEEITGEAETLAESVTALKSAAHALQDCSANLDEGVRALRSVLNSVEADSEELELLQERAMRLQELARLHDCEPLDLQSVQKQLQARVDTLSESLVAMEDLEPAVEAAAAEYRSAAAVLTRAREKAGKKLVPAVKAHLARLGMEKADFEIRCVPVSPESTSIDRLASAAGPAGLDDVQYRIRPNPGEDWGLLSVIASGGETTRIMLAVKSALAAVVRSDVLLFDEIDAGVGGRLGEAIADQLLELSRQRQVIAITHLPQIASRGDHHLCVRKQTRSRRTFTEIVEVTGEDRVQEIACMIRGEKSNQTTLTQAREMLASSSAFRENAKP